MTILHEKENENFRELRAGLKKPTSQIKEASKNSRLA